MIHRGGLVYPQKRVSLKKYPQMSEKGLGLPIYEIKPSLNGSGLRLKLNGDFYNLQLQLVSEYFSELVRVCFMAELI